METKCSNAASAFEIAVKRVVGYAAISSYDEFLTLVIGDLMYTFFMFFHFSSLITIPVLIYSMLSEKKSCLSKIKLASR